MEVKAKEDKALQVKAHTRHLRMSSRKVRLVVDVVRGMDVEPALSQLTFMSKAAARPVRKLLESAIANAEHNFKLEREGLYIKSAMVNQGPSLKRWRPRAMGSAAPILKRTCHITLILESKTGTKKASSRKPQDASGKLQAEEHDHDHAGHKHDEKLPAMSKAEEKQAAKKAGQIKAEEKQAAKQAQRIKAEEEKAAKKAEAKKN